MVAAVEIVEWYREERREYCTELRGSDKTLHVLVLSWSEETQGRLFVSQNRTTWAHSCEIYQRGLCVR